LVERDVEAPEIFSADDLGLWDGRPSLGGIWVAATDVRQPERVIIRNPANGKQVIGALFKKEHADDGLALMLSSDAAIALGVPAGQPTDITVTALRTREEPGAPIASSDPFDVEGVNSAEGYLGETGDSDTAAAPEIGTAVLGSETPDDLAAGPLPDPIAPVATAGAATAAAAVDALTESAEGATDAIASATETELEDSRTLPLERIAAAVAAANAADEAAGIEAPETTDASAAQVTETSIADIASAALEEIETPAPTPAEAPVETLATEIAPADIGIGRKPDDALPPVRTLEDQIKSAIEATEAAEERARELGLYVPEGLQPATPSDVTTTPLEGAALGPATGKPASREYIQIGTYGGEAAAKSAADRFDAAGLPAEVKPRGEGSSKVYRVVLGPVATVDQQSAALRKAREFGFSDAFPVEG
jgi:hypothetical protein